MTEPTSPKVSVSKYVDQTAICIDKEIINVLLKYIKANPDFTKDQWQEYTDEIILIMNELGIKTIDKTYILDKLYARIDSF